MPNTNVYFNGNNYFQNGNSSPKRIDWSDENVKD